MFVSRQHLLLAATSAIMLALFACNSTDSSDGTKGSGKNAHLTYEGKSWTLMQGICPGTTDYVTTFSLSHNDDARILYIQTKAFPTAGTYTVWGAANNNDSLAANEVGVSIYDVGFNAVNATGGTLTITRPSSTTLRFEGANIPFDNGKTASFSLTATAGCTAP